MIRRRWRVGVTALWALAVVAMQASPARAQVDGATGTDPGAQSPTPHDPPPPQDVGFRFHGYVRSGFGVDGSGKGLQPFKAPLAGAKYRLGNETETYLETTFDYGTLSEGDEPAYFDTRITLAYVAPTSQSNSFATTFSLREAYALARRIWPAQPEATFWAGARYYDRHDVHINDFYYRDPSGFGGGVENIALGERVRFAAAWIGGTQDELESGGTVPQDQLFRFNKNTFDLRVSGFAAGPLRLSAAVDVTRFGGDEFLLEGQATVLTNDGSASATGIVEWPFTGGRHKIAVQYGTGAASDFRSVLTPPAGRTVQPGETFDVDALWQFRVVNDFMLEQRGPVQLQAVAIYQELENGAAANSRIRWVSLGGRPVYALSPFVSFATEVGWDHTEQSDLPGGSLFKVTVAPQITPALKFLSRPSLRAFATWAHWSDSLRGSVAPAAYGDAVQGVSFGVQFESWW